MPLVIGIGGRLAAGKDEVADHLVATHGFIKMGMSDPLADALYVLNPRIGIAGDSDIVKEQFIFGQLYSYQDIIDTVGYVEAKTIPEVRSWLQKLGTEVGRDMLGKNIWVKAAESRIREQLNNNQNVVITGIRFPNELEMVNRLGNEENWFSGATLWISRPGLSTSKEAAQHASEGSVSEFDFQYNISNNGSRNDLYETADRFLAYLGMGRDKN